MTPRLNQQTLGAVWKAAAVKGQINGPLTPALLAQLLPSIQQQSSQPRTSQPPYYTHQLNLPKTSTSSSSSKQKTKSVDQSTRIYPQRKQFLNEYYTHLLSKSPLVLLFEHENLSNADLNRIRGELKKIPPPPPITPPPVDATTAKGKAKKVAEPKPIPQHATFQMIRTGLFSAVAKREQPEPIAFTPVLKGQRALITTPSLNPPYVAKVLQALNKALKASKRAEGTKQPRLELITGLLEGRTRVNPAELAEIAKLPDLDGLRGQLLGLLESQGRSLLGVLSQAGGGQLVRTLQGLEESLGGEKKEEEA